jgi:hypothetical protein
MKSFLKLALVASFILDMFRNLLLVKDHDIANNFTTAKAREK